MNKKIVLGLILLSIILVGNNLGIALADWSYVTDSNIGNYEWGGHDATIGTPSDNRGYTHISGKHIFAHIVDRGSETITIRVTGSDGTLLANNTYNLNGDYSTNFQETIYQLNSNEVLLIVYSVNGGSDGDTNILAYTYNINSYTLTYKDTVTIRGNNDYITSAITGRISEDCYLYEDNIYFWLHDMIYLTDDWLGVIKYDTTSETLSKVGSKSSATGSGQGGHNLVTFQDNEQTQNIYCMASVESTPEYFRYNIETDTFYDLADHPFSDRINDNGKIRDENLGGGVYREGDNIHVYFNWLHSHLDTGTNTRSIRIIQHRLQFNGTVQNANLTTQNERTGVITPTLSSDNKYIWVEGYAVNRTRLIGYYPQYISGEYSPYKIVFDIPDWLDYGVSTTDTEMLETEDIPFPFDEKSYVGKDFGKSYMTFYDDNSDELRIYYGLTPTDIEYDITLSYTPHDSPLIVDKSYSWTLTLTGNDVGVSRTIAIYIDGLQQSVTQTSDSGTLEFTFLSGISGVRTWKIDVLDNDGNTVYTESFSYTWSTGEEGERPASDVLLPTAISSMVQFFVPLVLIGAPMMTLGGVGSSVGGSSGGTIGFIVGGILGVAVTIMVGWFPNYLNYLLILAIISGVVLLFKGGN